MLLKYSITNLEEDSSKMDCKQALAYHYYLLVCIAVLRELKRKKMIKQFGEERSIIVRPTYMIGPADKSNRFLYRTLDYAYWQNQGSEKANNEKGIKPPKFDLEDLQKAHAPMASALFE